MRLTPVKLAHYARTIETKGAPTGTVWRFIDGTIREWSIQFIHFHDFTCALPGSVRVSAIAYGDEGCVLVNVLGATFINGNQGSSTYDIKAFLGMFFCGGKQPGGGYVGWEVILRTHTQGKYTSVLGTDSNIQVASNVNSCSYTHCVYLFPTLHTNRHNPRREPSDRQELPVFFSLFLSVLGVWHYAYLGYNSLPRAQVSLRSF